MGGPEGAPPPSGSTPKVIDLTVENSDREGCKMSPLIRAGEGNPTLNGYTPTTDAARAALERDGFIRMEFPATAGPSDYYYVSRTDYQTIMVGRLQAEQQRLASSAASLQQMTGPRGQGAQAPAGVIGEGTFFLPPRGGKSGPTFSPSLINNNLRGVRSERPVTAAERSTAEQQFRAQGMVPHEVAEDPGTQYWMTPTQWQAFVRAGGVISR